MPNNAFRVDDVPPDPVPGQTVRMPCHHKGTCRSNTHLYAWIVCSACGHGRWQWLQTWHRKQIESIGPTWLCRSCRQREKPKGGDRLIASGGYIKVALREGDPYYEMTAPDTRYKGRGYVLEHRLVAARKIGRPLSPSEMVHHTNGDRQDNRPENIEVWVLYQPAGVRQEEFHCACCIHKQELAP
jgi:hypothetical protein